MANGSFGLSGIPTAPTSVGSTPNNPLSSVSVAVNSTAGFQAGDLIYNFGGDIAPPPANYVTTATFPVVDNAPAYIQNVSFGQEVAPIVNTGSAYKVRNTAKLSNGNIVVVYLIVNSQATNSNYPAFKIVDEAGTVIVAQTIIGTASFNGNSGNISVCALPASVGGGFAMAWFENTNNYVSYAMYSNTGAVIKAPATDTGAGSISSSITFVQTYARSDGSWILAYSVTTGGQLWYKVFSATGTQVYAWTNPGSNNSSNLYFDFVVRSDNTFVIIFFNGGSQLHYQIRSALNAISTATTAISGATSISNIDGWGGATLLAGDITLVAFVRSGVPYYSSISAAGVASAAVAYPFYTLSGIAAYARPFTLADGNYILAYLTNNNAGNSQYDRSLNYAILNTSHALVSGVNQTLFSVTTSANAFPSFTQTTNFIHMCYSPLPLGATFSSSPSNNQTQINWLKFNPTTYQPATTFFVPTTVASSSAQAVSGYARSNSNPTAASFLSAAASTVSATTAQTTSASTLVVGQTTLDTSTAAYGLDTATLNDGSALVLYNVAGIIKLARISSAGVLLSTATVATNGYNTTVPGGVKIAVLSNGKIACAYINSTSTQANILILSSAYALETTLQVTSVGWSTNYGLDVAALTSDRFVFVYHNSGLTGVYYIVYSSSGTIIVSNTLIFNAGTSTALTCAGTPNGFFVFWYDPSNVGVRFAFYQETSTNSFNNNGTQLIGTSGRFFTDMRAITAPNGTVQVVYANNNVNQMNQLMHYSNGTPTTSGLTWSNINPDLSNTAACTLAITAYGDVSTIYWASSSSIRMMYTTAGFASGGNSSTYSVQITGLSMTSSETTAIFASCGLTGHNILLLAKNAIGQFTYCVINPISYSYSLALTAGVTASNPVVINPAKGFSLIGVSSTAAPANGSGTVVINGPAQLNSNYSASTTGQSFDFQNPMTFGVAGSISGRNITLIGNV